MAYATPQVEAVLLLVVVVKISQADLGLLRAVDVET
jgi:hypothetical protein